MKYLFKPQAVLFDLDGTLADTAPDLAFALNETLRHFGREPLAYEKIRPVVSHGGIALIKLGFGLQPDDAGFEQLRQHLLEVYRNNVCRETRLFPGMPEVLDALESAGVAWGIVTNKPGWLTDPLVAALGIDTRTPAVVSGDTCERRKPHPDPIHHACTLLNHPAESCWYVGDAGRDMQAGRAAGCLTIGATFGYIHPDDPVAAWDSDLDIADPLELVQLVRKAPHD